MQQVVTLREKKKGQVHKVFKDSFDAKAIFLDEFMEKIRRKPRWDMISKILNLKFIYSLSSTKKFQ